MTPARSPAAIPAAFTRRHLLALATAGASWPAWLQAQDFPEAALRAAVEAPSRSPANRLRDGARNPFETLRFFGVLPQHQVIEIAPGGGWYTEILAPYLPEGPWLHEEDALTDRSERFLASEIIREKLFRLTGDELPYSCTVVIDKFEEENALRRIAATIVVDREAHKGMVVGQGGERLKRIGTEARQDLEHLMGAKVFLELWVKVRSGWADDEAHLRSFGYE